MSGSLFRHAKGHALPFGMLPRSLESATFRLRIRPVPGHAVSHGCVGKHKTDASGVYKSACARFYPFFRLAAFKAMRCVMVNKKWTTGRRFIWPRTLVFGKAMRTSR